MTRLPDTTPVAQAEGASTGRTTPSATADEALRALEDRLRNASRALHSSDPEHTREWEACGWGDCVNDRKALAAARPAPLDVDRLAKALHIEELCWSGVDACGGPSSHGEAIRIAAAYEAQP